MKKRSVTPLFSLSVRCRTPSSCPNSPRRRSLLCPESSRDSCTAHRMPSRCMFLLVDISESIWCPLIISVSDMPTTKRATAPRAKRKTINHVGITVRYFYVLKFWLSVTNVYICKINCKNAALSCRRAAQKRNDNRRNTMKIVIAGAGEMGSHLAKMLSGNGHDITIIDARPEAAFRRGEPCRRDFGRGRFDDLRRAPQGVRCASATCSSP